MHAGGVDAVLNRAISSLLKDHATVHINFRLVQVWNTFYEGKSLLHDLETLPKVYMVRYKYNMSRTQLKPFYSLKQDFENRRSKDFLAGNVAV